MLKISSSDPHVSGAQFHTYHTKLITFHKGTVPQQMETVVKLQLQYPRDKFCVFISKHVISVGIIINNK